MGYDAAMFLASVILLMPMLGISALLWALAWSRDWFSGRWPGAALFLLILSGAYTALYIGSAVNTLVVQPASLQRTYLGRQEAGMFALRSYTHDGFMDPADQWEYVVSEQVRAALAGRCKSRDRGACVLYSESDDRWFAHVTLSGNRLLMTDGSH